MCWEIITPQYSISATSHHKIDDNFSWSVTGKLGKCLYCCNLNYIMQVALMIQVKFCKDSCDRVLLCKVPLTMCILSACLCGEQTLYMEINNLFTNLKLERKQEVKQIYNIGVKKPDNSQSKNWFVRLHYFLYAEGKSPRNILCVRSSLSVSGKQEK